MTEPTARRSRSDLPREATAYRTIGPFDAATLPAGIRAKHRLKAGAWGVLRLSEGSLRFVWDDCEGGVEDLHAPAEVVIPPQVPHHVEGTGPFTADITFYRS
ncbi:DUF1971 domain-containing protein [Altererythrobacter salegens]|uniref:DUF1971 domain-containing protein n=1 Tax=Croceibacterium salegens TaxID=1737568 RepID=A0A6I4SUK9_9SPHN|nr:DUF1971 domain-containing protein [Croceibacterium salegens]MXO58670.1 DUF1971 domain-containing protein [Croceibacterium salegens]